MVERSCTTRLTDVRLSKIKNGFDLALLNNYCFIKYYKKSCSSLLLSFFTKNNVI